MIYSVYKDARNAAWQCLIDYNIREMPVIVSAIAKQSGIVLLRNSKEKILTAGQSGLSLMQNGVFYIIYNDSERQERCRFTVAHELGHIFLGHLMIDTPVYRTFDVNNKSEIAANIFARDLLAPACVLHELHATSPKAISNLCNISIEAANYRAKRLAVLEKRNAWYSHPLERKIYNQFSNFITNYN